MVASGTAGVGVVGGFAQYVIDYRSWVLGFEVSLSNLTKRQIEATSYEVADDGALVLRIDDALMETILPADWIEIQAMGLRLSDSWPYPNMHLLLENLAEQLGVVYGHYVHGLRQPENYSSGLLNEFESLTAALLSSVCIDPNSTDEKAVIRCVRERDYYEGVRSFASYRPPTKMT